MYEGYPIAVLDTEVLHSADELPTKWDNKLALGLSIGCQYTYTDGLCHWFDVHTLEATMRQLLDYTIVSFNGIGFDGPLMRALLRAEADVLQGTDPVRAGELRLLCDAFKVHMQTGYDILAMIWQVDPKGKFKAGLNSLDAIVQANGLAAKLGSGTEAPKWWRAGQIARVLEYCQWDVMLTKTLFERLMVQGGQILRGDQQVITLPLPQLPLHDAVPI